jgi:hypothetical protein
MKLNWMWLATDQLTITARPHLNIKMNEAILRVCQYQTKMNNNIHIICGLLSEETYWSNVFWWYRSGSKIQIHRTIIQFNNISLIFSTLPR